jgi:hypothetical protein
MERNVLGGGLQRDQHEHGTGWRAALIAAAVQSSKGPAGDECDGARPGVPGVVFSNCMAYCGGKPFRAGSSVRLPGYEQDILFPIQPPPFLEQESYLCCPRFPPRLRLAQAPDPFRPVGSLHPAGPPPPPPSVTCSTCGALGLRRQGRCFLATSRLRASRGDPCGRPGQGQRAGRHSAPGPLASVGPAAPRTKSSTGRTPAKQSLSRSCQVRGNVALPR